MDSISSIETIIGWNVRQARERMGFSQEELGEAIVLFQPKKWPRQTVSALEKGDRLFTAAELITLAIVLGTNVVTLLTPPMDVSRVQVANGELLSRDMLAGAVRPRASEATTGAQIEGHIQELAMLHHQRIENLRAEGRLLSELSTLVAEKMTPNDGNA